jgi:hypothetical protein
VSNEEIERVKQLIEVLQMRQSLLSETTLVSDDALCTICYAQQNDVFFEPCYHQSCHSCIIQHLMSVRNCFYCMTFVTAVKKLDGTILYEQEPPNSPQRIIVVGSSTANVREENEEVVVVVESSSSFHTPSENSRDTQTPTHENDNDDTSN